jgi:hypothetical protein
VRHRLLLTLVFLAVAPAPALGAGSLALTPADAPGLAVREGAAAEARALAVSLAPQALRRTVRRARLYASGYEDARFRLLSAVVVLRGDRGLARIVVRAGGERLRIADGARSSVTGDGAQATVALRFADSLGLVRITAVASGSDVRAPAEAYARLLASRIELLRGRPGWDRVARGVRADGSVPRAVALRAFALQYGRVPGVASPRGSAGEDGTAVLAAVAREWRHLTARQRRVVRRRAVGAPVGKAHMAKAPPVTRSPAHEFVASDLADLYQARLGFALPFPIRVYRAKGPSTQTPSAEADAWPGPWTPEPPASPSECRIRLYPLGLKGGTDYQTLVLAHEVFHCFQFAIAPNWWKLPWWVLEGTAEWAAQKVAAATGGESFMVSWYATPERPLFKRDYDAVGFWGVVEQYAPEGLWPRMFWVLRASSSTQSFADAGGNLDTVVHAWASAQLRDETLGGAWLQRDPIFLGYAAAPTPKRPLAGTAPLKTPPFTAKLYEVQSPAGPKLVTATTSSGHLRGASRSQDFPDAANRWFCIGGECSCKPGETSSVPQHDKVADNELTLALAGGGARGRASVEFHDVSEFCKPATTVIWTGTWASNVYAGLAGTFTMRWIQTGQAITGDITIVGSPCNTTGTVSGQLSGNTVTFGAIAANQQISYSGTIAGNTMSGTYTSAPNAMCAEDSGTWSATRAS